MLVFTEYFERNPGPKPAIKVAFLLANLLLDLDNTDWLDFLASRNEHLKKDWSHSEGPMNKHLKPDRDTKLNDPRS